MNKRKQMSVKEMWKFCLFQAKGYRILPVILVLGMLSGASVVYINSFLYAKILDVLLEEKYQQAATFVVILVVTVMIVSSQRQRNRSFRTMRNRARRRRKSVLQKKHFPWNTKKLRNRRRFRSFEEYGRQSADMEESPNSV